uniref:Preprotein translocase subunit SecY n=1 Tax=Ahnfeltia plicata TaxID=28023 RepID=A0A0A7A798_9FLOR|nr:preprotein translocase subunit SecY [Ahnfeltia plicata]AHB62122.1 preprotein translocase subunit SecY [Ahnfeltia plicata]UAT97984.1 preprotein translocase subunit SecY [Ahnfeltia plicata]
MITYFDMSFLGKTFPVNIYIAELFFRTLYVFISFIFCTIILFYHVDLILLLETYPFLKFSHKKFIATQVTDLFDTACVLCVWFSFTAVFPLVYYQTYLFLCASWYKYQVIFFKELCLCVWFSFLASISIFHINLLPRVLEFFSHWEMRGNHLFLQVEVESRISLYVYWILSFQCFFGYLIYTLLFLFVNLFYLVDITSFYKLLQTYRKQGIFMTIVLIFFLAPPEPSLQLFLVLIVILLYELLFLFSCLKFYQTSRLVFR